LVRAGLADGKDAYFGEEQEVHPVPWEFRKQLPACRSRSFGRLCVKMQRLNGRQCGRVSVVDLHSFIAYFSDFSGASISRKPPEWVNFNRQT
jgi:hypothetical protein